MKETVDLPEPLGQCLIKFNRKDQKIIWEIYCELLPLIGINEINEEEDLFIDVISSWDNFYNFAVQKIKELGPKNLGPSIQKKGDIQIFLGSMILELINQHMRPFIRKWKEKFYHFWNRSLIQNPEIDSIKRQIAFPEYTQLFKEILNLQRTLKANSEVLYVISQVKSRQNYIYAAVIISVAALIIFFILFYTTILPASVGDILEGAST
ncbi:MAG: hypothetical protein ACFFDN_03070 [Candidatus Hodarchaeota archaeon]